MDAWAQDDGLFFVSTATGELAKTFETVASTERFIGRFYTADNAAGLSANTIAYFKVWYIAVFL